VPAEDGACTLALHHIAPKDRLAAEIRRVLKPGGRLLIAEFQPVPGQPARLLTGVLFGHAIAERLAVTVSFGFGVTV
jgi:ubiquinone/menaquinone biosynthesis C-methylase UbiE